MGSEYRVFNINVYCGMVSTACCRKVKLVTALINGPSTKGEVNNVSGKNPVNELVSSNLVGALI